MAPTDIMYSNEMIKNWLARHNRIDGESDASMGSSTSDPKTKNPALNLSSSERRPKSKVQSPTSKVKPSLAIDY